MEKPAFTTDDVSNLTAELYSLSDDSLLAEANAIAADFYAWMESKFDLTPDQTTYIASFPEHIKKFYGYACAAAFISRGPVNLGSIPLNQAPRRIKETRANLFGEISYNNGDQELVGALSIDLGFELLD